MDLDLQLERLGQLDAVARLVARDHTLWQDDPTEVADRLGWLDCPAAMAEHVGALAAFATGLPDDGIERVVVLGMGGSSLFPEVLRETFGATGLSVLDTTDPAAVARAGDDATLFLAASKSGSTIETRSHLERFWADRGDPARFAVTTDPGSALGALARERGFRAVFENPPDIGGRYSALSLFGLVPAAVAGVDPAALLAGGAAAIDRLDEAAELAAAMAAGVAAGRDKLTFVIDERLATFGLWVEQLIAESTGKLGTGVIPVVGEPLGGADAYGDDRLFVAIGEVGDVPDPAVRLPLRGDGLAEALGAQVVLWEAATALCGALLGINPFDQPDVAAAKAATQAVLDAGAIPDEPLTPVAEALAQVRPGDYVSIHAYVDPGSPAVAGLEAARTRIRDGLRVATTVGLGPRFLHSTGQLHKGGPPTGVFLQVVGDDPVDVAIPGQPFTFSTLKQAQAAGDLRTLRDRGLRAARVSIDELTAWEAAR